MWFGLDAGLVGWCFVFLDSSIGLGRDTLAASLGCAVCIVVHVVWWFMVVALVCWWMGLGLCFGLIWFADHGFGLCWGCWPAVSFG